MLTFLLEVTISIKLFYVITISSSHLFEFSITEDITAYFPKVSMNMTIYPSVRYHSSSTSLGSSQRIHPLTVTKNHILLLPPSFPPSLSHLFTFFPPSKMLSFFIFTFFTSCLPPFSLLYHTFVSFPLLPTILF